LPAPCPGRRSCRPHALYHRVPRLLSDLALARLDGRWSRLLVALAKVDVLVLDDLALRPLTTDQAADLLESSEDRNQRRSTIVTSNCPSPAGTTPWGATLADATLDRLLHNAHRVELHGDSLRRRHDPSEPQLTAQTVQLLQSMRCPPDSEPLRGPPRRDDHRLDPYDLAAGPPEPGPGRLHTTNPTFLKEVSTGKVPDALPLR